MSVAALQDDGEERDEEDEEGEELDDRAVLGCARIRSAESMGLQKVTYEHEDDSDRG